MNQRKIDTERRKWSRLPLAIPVFVRGSDENGTEFLEFASVLNISASGSLIALAHPLRLSAQVVLEIPTAPLASVAVPASSSQRLAATVVRVIHAEGFHLVAFEFADSLLLRPSARVPRRRKSASSM